MQSIDNENNKTNLYLNRLTELGAEICKQKRWKIIKITELSDFNFNVLGTNINKGSQIKIRLKNINNEYYPWFELIGTLCHELAHNVIVGHPTEFYVFMNQIHDDIEKLPRYEEIFAEMTGSYYSKGYSLINNGYQLNNNGYNLIDNNTNIKKNKKQKSKFYISNGLVVDQSIKKTKTKTQKQLNFNKSRQNLILQSLERRGLV